MLAAGMKPGDLLHVVGTTQVLAAFADPPCPAVCRLTRPLGVGPDFIHVTHNPVGGEALRWLFDLCERDANQTDADAIRLARAHFFETTVPAALDRPTTVILDPPFLGGDRLEVDERTATFRGLTLDTTRLDLVAAVLNGMRKGHAKALADLGLGTSWPRVFLTGGGSEIVEHLNLYPGSQIVRFDDGSLRGVARLFAGPS
jgi:sugar (pentulose or hexulose) kinase